MFILVSLNMIINAINVRESAFFTRGKLVKSKEKNNSKLKRKWGLNQRSTCFKYNIYYSLKFSWKLEEPFRLGLHMLSLPSYDSNA